MKWFRRVVLVVLALAAGPVLVAACGPIRLGQDWRTADRSSSGVAPPAAETPEAIVQVYAARAFNWRGIFAVHTWIATKAAGAGRWRVHQVVGWRRWRGLPVVVSATDVPDRSWYGNRPEVVSELRGPEAEAAIPRIEAAVRRYPWPERYTLWPGPNSNTFTAWVGRQVPEIGMDLPTTAIGKDYLGSIRVIDRAPSGTGFQLSLFGVLGLTAALREGLEFNLLGLSFGLDPLHLAIKLPGIGRIGPG